MKNEKEKNMSKQYTLEMSEYIETLEKQIQEGFKGKITDIIPTTSAIFYGQTDDDTYEDREGWCIVVNAILDDGSLQEFKNFIAKPSVKGYYQTSLYKFKQFYGSIPKIDMDVKVIIDENGFLKLKL